MSLQNELQKQFVQKGVEFFKTNKQGYYNLAMRFGKCKTTLPNTCFKKFSTKTLTFNTFCKFLRLLVPWLASDLHTMALSETAAFD
jgi:hypothetical protein